MWFPRLGIADALEGWLDVAIVIGTHGGHATLWVYKNQVWNVADAVFGYQRSGPSPIVAIGFPTHRILDGFGGFVVSWVDIEAVGEGMQAVGILLQGLTGVVVDGGGTVFPIGPETDQEPLATGLLYDFGFGETLAHLQRLASLFGCKGNEGVCSFNTFVAQAEGIAFDADVTAPTGHTAECGEIGVEDDPGVGFRAVIYGDFRGELALDDV